MRIRLFIFLVCFFPSLHAQVETKPRIIEWREPGFFRQGNIRHRYLNFHRAVFPDQRSLLPHYSENIKIGKESEISIELIDKHFVPLDEEERRIAESTTGIGERIVVQSEKLQADRSSYFRVSFVPLRKNRATGKIEKLREFAFRMVAGPSGERFGKQHQISGEYTGQSVLARGIWYRIKVEETGVYCLHYDDLQSMELPDPSRVKIFGQGGGMLPLVPGEGGQDDLRSVPVWYEKGTDGVFGEGDRLYFYAEGPDEIRYDPGSGFFETCLHKFASVNYYFLTSVPETPGSMPILPTPSGPADLIATSGDAVVHHEQDDLNLIRSGSEWYGELFDIQTSRTFAFDLPGLSPGEDLRVRVDLIARATASTRFDVRGNGTLLGSLIINGTDLSNYTAQYAFGKTGNYTFTPTNSSVEIGITYHKNGPSARGWLNYLTLNYRRDLKMDEDQLLFRDTRTVGTGNITEFRILDASSSLMVWDVTDPLNVKNLNTELDGTVLSFRVRTDSLRQFVAFDPAGNIPGPVMGGEDTGPVPNQNLHGMPAPDYVIISQPAISTEARRLAGFRKEHDGLDTLVVTPEQIYNEFSSGKPDVAAIRNFIKSIRDRSMPPGNKPGYVLLFGDGSYDNRKSGDEWQNYLLTYQSANSLSPLRSFVTDDFFGMVDDGENVSDGLVDIGVGRMPVSDMEEARSMVDKVISYHQSDKMGNWRNVICFIGDDEDGNTHMRQADELAGYVDEYYPDFVADKIYLDAYQQISTPSGQRYPDVNRAVTERVSKGALIVNYTGHGGANGLAHEQILNTNDIKGWTNRDKLPLFMTATCEFSRFDDHENTSAGELLLLNPQGGGIALLSTTRLVYSSPNHVLNEWFYEYVFEKDAGGDYFRLGDVIRLTKNASGPGINKRNFSLLGDPAARLAFPEYRIVTARVNGKDVQVQADTVRALSKVRITGAMEDPAGNALNDYEGTLYPLVFDKPVKVRTLSNDGGTPFEFELQNRVLFRGKASISGGRFSFGFVVPRDISYRYGYGKVSYYGSNLDHDAQGVLENIVIGGSADSIAVDNTGPEMEIYMNDEKFVYGGYTDEDPELYVIVSDQNGINTAGTGIGHDLTAVLDENTSGKIVLNDYYESDTDSYKRGRIRYPFKDMENGSHTVRVKLWDVYNNSSEGQTEFIVSSSEEMVIEHLLNYPNPFTTHTAFYFDHNQPGVELRVQIQIFTVSGKLVKSIERVMTTTGYRSPPIHWNGLDDYGDKIGRGVYIYRIKIRSDTGQTAEEYQKLVILR